MTIFAIATIRRGNVRIPTLPNTPKSTRSWTRLRDWSEGSFVEDQ
jgi:hypothetical protein